MLMIVKDAYLKKEITEEKVSTVLHKVLKGAPFRLVGRTLKTRIT